MRQKLEEILTHGCGELDSDLFRFLVQQDMLVEEEAISRLADTIKASMDQCLKLIMMPTEACNFRCPYCYENHSPTFMTQRTIEHIQNFIACNVKMFKQIQLNWFGGEPTLCKDIVQSFNQFVQNLQRGNLFQFSSSMTTNGYLLDIATFKSFYFSGVTSYQITLDGWTHDNTRPHVNGSGTIKTILENLKRISDLPKDSYQFDIILRHNILDHDDDLTWYDHLKELFGTDERFAVLVRPVSDFGGHEVMGLDLLSQDSMNTEVLKHIDYLDEIQLKKPKEEDSENVASHICYAAYQHSYVFRANGLIEKCTVSLNHPLNKVGYVDETRGVIIYDQANQPWHTVRLRKKCPSCKHFITCLNQSCPKSHIIDHDENQVSIQMKVGAICNIT